MERVAYYATIRPLPANNVVRTILFCRDEYECQYCGVEVTFRSGTRDHITPKSHFKGKNSEFATVWTNCVVACEPCNTLKADKLLYEAGMPKPRIRPVMPHHVRLDHHGKMHHIQPQLVFGYFKAYLDTDETVKLSGPPSLDTLLFPT